MNSDSEPEPDENKYDADNSLTTEQFLKRMKEDELKILTECKGWQEKYKVDVHDSNKILEDGIPEDLDGLDEEDKAAARRELDTMKHMETQELLEAL